MERHQHSLLSAALCFDKVKFSSTAHGRHWRDAECMIGGGAEEERRGRGGEGGEVEAATPFTPAWLSCAGAASRGRPRPALLQP